MAKKHSLEVKQRKYGYYFTLPFIIGAIIFVLVPTFESIIYSFAEVKNDINGTSIFGVQLTNWGIHNFKDIWLDDTSFRELIVSSLKSMATNVPVVVIFAFFMASILNTKFVGRGFARSIMFLPVIISSGLVVALGGDSLASSIISSGDRFASTGADSAIQVTEVFQTMLESMDLGDGIVDLIVNSVSGISTIVSMAAVSIVIFIAGLQSISPSIYEASYIEGATKWEVFWKISLPMVSPLILLSVIYTIVDNFNGSNNPVISSIHQNVVSTEFDTASAMAVSYSLIILVILVVVFAILNKVVFYEE